MKKTTHRAWPLMLSIGFFCAGNLWAQTPGVTANTESTPIAAQPANNLNTMPKWSEFPLMPTNVPTADDIKTRVSLAEKQRRQLKTEVRAIVWDEGDPDAYAKAALGRIDTNASKTLSPNTTVDSINAKAAELHRRATPPPIAK